MESLLVAYPGARRALFKKYHIGGCSSCGFQPSETLAQVCARSGNPPMSEVIPFLESSRDQDSLLEIHPTEAADRKAAGGIVRWLDIRTREEWEATRIPGSEFVNQELVQELMSKSPRDAWLIFYDHQGKTSLDAAAYFSGHGFANARSMVGGIDAWSLEVDATIPRYRLETT